MQVSGPRRWYEHAKALGRPYHLFALVGFTLITVAMTYPITFTMGSAVKDTSDPVFNTWVIAWNAHSLLTGSPRGLFDTNIFYPAPDTAAYSEYLIPQSLIAAPVLSVSGNPILAYNVVLLIAIVTSAFAAYLLASHLTDRLGGFVAGLIFAFNPFMMNHLSHVQLLSAAGIPLAFLSLHEFFTDGRTRHLLLFSLFYAVVALANTYYGLYLTLFAGLYILFHIVQRRRYLDGRFWLQMALHASISLLVVGPFLFKYFLLRRDFGLMIRQEESVATAASFLATPPINRLYGDATKAYFTNEAGLFPGLCALVLAAIGVWGGLTARQRRLDHLGPSWVATAYRVSGWALVLLGALIVEILAGGGIDTTVFSIPIRATSLGKPVGLTIAFLATRVGLKRRYSITSTTSGKWDTRLVYIGMLVLAVVLTLPTGVSGLLHHRVPGFDGVRSVSRMHVLTMLAVSVLAAYGVAVLAARLGRRRGIALAIAILVTVALGVEYVSVPVPALAVPVEDEIPEVYRWLASQDEDFAVAEYPIEPRLQVWQVYFSTYHWKRLVTGASAFTGLTYIELIQRQEGVPSPSTLDDFERIGVRYLIVHDWPFEDIAPEELQAEVDLLSDRLRLVTTLDSYDIDEGSKEGARVVPGGRARVYELTRSDWRPPRLVRRLPTRADAEVLSSDRAAWTLSASTNSDLMPLAVDGDMSTRWYSLQRPGQFFQLDLGRKAVLNGVVLDISGKHPMNWPRGYRVEVSRDGEHWSSVAKRSAYRPPLTEFLRPKRRKKVDIPFPATSARYVRVVQTGTDVDYRWSISEINVTTPRETGTKGP